MNKLAILILAAGKSTRFGSQTKQLFKYEDETLLEITVKKAQKITKNVFVVLGHDKENCKKQIQHLDVNIVYNSEFEKGIGNSIAVGIKQTEIFKNTLIMLCDQPFIPLSHFEELIKSIKDEKIIASIYGNSPTVPAIFPKKYYKELLKLDADKGAKAILQNEDCLCFELEKKFAADIDTKEDINRF